MNLNHTGLYTALLLSLTLYACGEERDTPAPRPAPPAQNPGDGAPGPEDPASKRRMKISVGEVVFEASLGDNPAAVAFAELLPLRITMQELNGNEKYYYLPSGLPVSAIAPGRVEPGELMLFGSDCLVLFYESFATSYRYTPVGRIDNPQRLAAALGRGSATLKFELLK